MDYQTCLKSCISNARAAGAESDIETYESYPPPSEAAWAQCLQEVIDGGEDIQNPYHCMGAYEVRLHRQGFNTVFGCMVDELKAIAIKVGVPSEHVADVVMLWAHTHTKRKIGPSGTG
jgi:hypothetical protein